MPWRVFGYWALVLIYEGQGTYDDANGLHMDIEPGALIVVFPTLGHSYGPRHGQTWRQYYVVFEGAALQPWVDARLLREDHPVWRLQPVGFWQQRFADLFERWAALGLARLPIEGPGVESVSEFCRLMQFLAQALEADGRGDRTVQTPAADESPRDRAWGEEVRTVLAREQVLRVDWDHLARRLHMSSAAFRRRFQRVFHMPPARYHRRQLIEHACNLMHEGRWNDKQIALELGFCDEFHFSHTFKRIVGMGPRAFRRRIP